MRVLFLAAEAAPLVKVGGLGDVAGYLPLALRSLPTKPDVRLVLPLHGAIDTSKLKMEPVAACTVTTTTGELTVQAFLTSLDGLPIYLITGPGIPLDSPVYSPNPGDDAFKYIFFSLGALEVVRSLNWRPDVVHANDWHTAPAVYAISRNRQTGFFSQTSTLLTVHNLPYMGDHGSTALEAFGLPPVQDNRLPEWARHLPLPLGLLTADHITTVSPRYASEILTPEFGCGLDDLLRQRKDCISGVLNGLNTKVWNPQTDPELVARYGWRDLTPRRVNKAHLQEIVGLPLNSEIPLMAMVTRLEFQKGVDIALEGLKRLSDLPWQFVLLGTGSPQLESAAAQLQSDFPERVRVRLEYNAVLSHQIFAGADMLLLPSRYEPCGLTQMIAMRYGCVPIAHEVGGLADTVDDVDLKINSTGFLFPQATPESLAFALRRALALFTQPRRWVALQRRGMKRDFSWKSSAGEYLRLYQALKSRT
jgi:starch synthase